MVLELAPTADPGLSALLAKRGYGIQAFQQVLLPAVDLAGDLDGLADDGIGLGGADADARQCKCTARKKEPAAEGNGTKSLRHRHGAPFGGNGPLEELNR